MSQNVVNTLPDQMTAPSGLSLVPLSGVYQLPVSPYTLYAKVGNSLVVIPTTGSSLPTTLPSTSGVLWNNGGVVCVS